MIRRLAITTAAMCCLGSLAACERAGPVHKLPSAGTLVVLIGPAGPSQEWAAIRDGAVKYLEGVETLRIETVAPRDASRDALAELTALVLSRKPKAALVYHFDERLNELLAPLRAAGILAVQIGSPVEQASAFAHVAPDWMSVCAPLVRKLGDAGEGRVTAAVLWDSSADVTETAVARRLIAAIESEHRLRILETIDLAQSGQTLPEAVASVLRRYPNLGFIITPTAQPWLDARAADWETWRGLSQRFRYATPRGVPELWDDLRSGRATALGLQVDGELGAEAGRLAMEGLIGTRVWGTMRLWPCEAVSGAELESFVERYEAARGGGR